MFVPKPHEIYKHFKGNLYQITAIAEHTETGEQLVVYQAMYGDFRIYARPLSMFVSRVDREKYPESAQEFRFELQGPEAERQRQETTDGQAEEPKHQEEATDGQAEEPKRQAEATDGQAEASEEPALEPLLVEFLDADSYEQRLNILAALRHRITDDMITTMAIACDVEINDGDTMERYEALKTCLLTLEKYECNRLR